MSLGNFVKRLRDIMRPDTGVNGDAQRIEQITWLLFLKVYDAKEGMWEFHDDGFRSIIPEELRWRNWAVDRKDGEAMTGDALLTFVNNRLFPTLKNLPVDENTPASKLIVRAAFTDNNNYMKNGVLLRQVVNVIDELDLDEYSERHAFGEIYEEILRSLQSAGSSGEFYTPRAVTDFMAQQIAPKLGESIADFACGTGGFLTSALKVLDAQVQTPVDREKYNTSVYGIEAKALPHLLCVTNMLLHDIDSPTILHTNSLEKNVREYREPDRFHVILMNPPYGGSELDSVKNNFPAEFRSSETADLFMTLIMYRLRQDGRAAVIIPDGFLFGGGAKTAIKKKLVTEFNLHTVIRMPHSVFAPYTSITTNILFFDKSHKTRETWFYRLDMPEGYKHFSKTKPMKLKHFAPVIGWWNDRKPITIDGFDKARCYTAQDLAERDYNLDLCGYPHEEEEILPPHELIQKYQADRAKLNADIDLAMARVDGIFTGNGGHSEAHHLSTLMEKLLDINAAFPARLKKSILQAAVQGKLVKQNPHDAPVDEPEYEGETPFDVPEGWKWARLGDVGTFVRGNGIKRTDTTPEGVPCVRYGELYTTYDFSFTEAVSHVPQKIADGCKTITYGDILLTLTGENKEEIGKATAFIGHQTTVIGGDLTKFTAHRQDPMYLAYFLFSPYAIYEKARLSTGDIIVHISAGKLGSILIPLPPLAEQKRIVARVEELLAAVEG